MNSSFKLILFLFVIILISLIVISVILDKSKTNLGSFQKTILVVAIIFLLINLVIISLGLTYSSKNNTWPPIVPDCPDYWESVTDESGNNIKCVNTKDLGVCNPSSGDAHLSMNFNQAPYVGDKSNCAKYTWANKCKVAWDGINYGVKNPCV
jgi:hypothetical protein